MTQFDYEVGRTRVRYWVAVYQDVDCVAMRLFWTRRGAVRWAKEECHVRRALEIWRWHDSDVRRIAA